MIQTIHAMTTERQTEKPLLYHKNRAKNIEKKNER